MLKPLERDKHNHFSTLDIETAPSGDMLVGGLFNGEDYNLFRSWEDFITFIKANGNQKCYQKIVAHNGGAFDYVSLVEYLIKTDIKFEAILSGSKIIMLVIFIGKHKIKFLDSYLVLLQSLAKVSDTFELGDEGKGVIDYKNIDKIFKTSPDIVINHLKKDLSALYLACNKFMEFIKIDFFPVTISSLSMYIFRKRFLKESFLKIEDKMIDDFMTRGYSGGRVEVFKAGVHKKIWCYDINSLYPFIMQSKPVPLGSPIWTSNFITDKLGFYEVEFEQYDKTIPPVLWQKTPERGLEFVYQGQGVFYSEELNALRSTGGSFKVTRRGGYCFPFSKILFKEFINYYYQIRQENKGGKNYIAKILMNSLYGKFGEREEKEKLVILNGEDLQKKIKEGKEIKLYMPEYNLFIEKQTRSIPHRQIQIAASITANARLELYKYLKEYARHVVYCDTDSLHLNIPLAARYIGLRLGQFKFEGHNEGLYLGRKQYCFGDKIKFKGVAIKSLCGNKLDKKDLQSINKNGKVNYEYAIFPKLKSVLKGLKACALTPVKKELTKGKYLTNYGR